MGIEYQLRFSYRGISELESILRSAPSFENFEPNIGLFNFRSPSNRAGMPDAWARIESGGLYFSANSNEGKQVLRGLLDRIGAAFGPPEVEEL